jgi:hypothetical protein
MPRWICETCGQRIVRARDGWLSGVVDGQGRAAIKLVHHLAASPWAALGGCYPADERASLPLVDVRRADVLAAVRGLLDAVGTWNADALASCLARVLSQHAAAAEAFRKPEAAAHPAPDELPWLRARHEAAP